MSQSLEFKIPEGYVFDKDNSTDEIIRFKPIKKKITYQDVISNIKATNIGVSVQFGLTKIGEDYFVTSEEQLKQLLALNKLMNVAKYLNGDWEPDWNDRHQHKWFIFYDHQLSGLYLAIHYTQRFASVYFKSEELALRAIEILGEEEVKKALGIFE